MDDRKDLLGWCSLLSRREDGRPIVVEAGGRRTLQFDGLTIQSEMAIDDPAALALDYTRMMMGFLLFQPAPRHVAMIGLGGGSLVKYCLATLPQARVTAVEVNPDVIALRDTFGIPPDGPRLEILHGDGADYVRDAGSAADVLLVDAYDAGGMPGALGTADFYGHCHAMLADGGTLVVNLWSGDRRYGLYANRIRDTFDDRYVVAAAEDGTNRIVFASKDSDFPPRRAQLLERARALAAHHPIDIVSLAQRIQHRIEHRRELRGDALPSRSRPRRR